MGAYNRTNGEPCCGSKYLLVEKLRQEWGFRGVILTDWWMQRSKSPEFPAIRDNAYRIRAQVDVLMPGGESFAQRKYVFDRAMLSTLGKKDGLTRAELQRGAINVLKFALLRMEEGAR